MELHDDAFPVSNEGIGMAGAHELPLLPDLERKHGAEALPAKGLLGGGESPGIDEDVEVAGLAPGHAPVGERRQHRPLVGNRLDSRRRQAVDHPAQPSGEEEAPAGVRVAQAP